MDQEIQKIARTLFINGQCYRYKKITGNPGTIRAVSLEITHRCIAKCIMCNIWRIPVDEPELSADEWLKLLSDSVFKGVRELDITGGEPFILDDIDVLFKGIGELKNSNLKELQSVAVTTNGFLTQRILEKIETILDAFKTRGLDLVIVCAMDAANEIHEKIRNVKNAWDRVNSTIEGLIKLRTKYSNLIIGLKTTILPINVDQLESISGYANERGLFTIISPCIVTSGRYLNKETEKDLIFSEEDKQKMISFFKGSRFKWSFHAESLVQYFETGEIKKPCSCGFSYFFIRSSGELFLCPLINESIGNIKNDSPASLLASDKARAFRQRVGEFPECRDCTEPGLERYALPYEGFTYLNMLAKYGEDEFIELHKHLGLEKYF